MKNPPFILKVGLFYKIASLVSITLMIAIGVSTSISIRQQGQTIKTELIEKNKAVSKHLASSIKNAFWSLNWLFVERQMQEITKSEDTLFLKLIKPNREVYLYSGSKNFDKDALLPELKDLKNQVIKDIVCSISGEPLKLIITPIMVGNEKWDLIMGLSLKAVEAAKKVIIRENIVLAGIIFLLGVLVSFFFARGMTRPIKRLVEGTRQIGKGNLDYEINIMSHDELGSLADSFNAMAKDLKNTMASRDQLANEINERRKAEDALKESEERFRSIVENSHGGIFIVDNDYRFIYVNVKLCAMLGYPMGEIIGRNFQNFLDEESKELVADRYRRRQKGESLPSIYEFNIVRKNGEKRRVEISVTVINDSKGIPQTIAQILDITERKKLESQLQQAQKMETIGILAGGVAHDLNNILSGIVSYPELILMDLPEDSPLRRPISTIKKSGENAAIIVQDLLTLARRGVTTTEVVNLNSVISNQLKSPESEKLKSFHPDVQIETNLERDLLNVKGSITHLSKTVMNLVSNAAEAMQNGGNMYISTENLYIDRPLSNHDYIEEGDYVSVTVSDTGIGISKEDIGRIFEPFYTKKVMGRSGTGLGMAVVWGTIKDHNGYIDVKSTEGVGTTFTLYFPAIREKLAADKALLSIEYYAGKGESILVVDDVEEQRDIASVMLEKLGYSVTSVSNGEEAIEYMKNNSADLLVLDMIMDPGIDGLDTYKKILELHPGQKAIIASGFSETDRVKAAQQLGARKYIKKPYTLEKIGLAVKEALGE